MNGLESYEAGGETLGVGVARDTWYAGVLKGGGDGSEWDKRRQTSLRGTVENKLDTASLMMPLLYPTHPLKSNPHGKEEKLIPLTMSTVCVKSKNLCEKNGDA